MTGYTQRRVFACFIWILALALPLQASAEEKKITGSGELVAILSQTKMYPGDDPQHEVTLSNLHEIDRCDDPALDNADVKVVGVSDYTAGSGEHWGYRMVTLPDGDQTFASYEGTTVTVAGEEGNPKTTFSGKWWYTSGTGKFKGIRGSGTYSGRMAETGLTYEWEGSYSTE